MVFRVCLLCSHILWHHYQYKVHDIPLPAEFNDYNLGDHLSEELLELVKKGDNEIEFFPKWFRDVESPDEADVFIPLYVGGYVEDLKCYLEKLLLLKGKLEPSYEALQWHLHKTYLRDVSERGVDISRSEFVEGPISVENIDKIVNEWYPNKDARPQFLIIKPIIGAASTGIVRVDIAQLDNEEKRKEYDELLPKDGSIVQQYVHSVSTTGEIALVYFNGEHSYTVRKVCGKTDFRMHPKYGADVENYTATPEMIAYCDNAMQTVQTILKEKFNVTDTLVYVRFDILVNDGEDSKEHPFFINEIEIQEPFLFFTVVEEDKRAEKLAKCIKSRFQSKL